jgi:hypothetical protein
MHYEKLKIYSNTWRNEASPRIDKCFYQQNELVWDNQTSKF